jgi:mannose-6-phosphate isomerase-like protein (cupin superfamily)
VKKGTEDESPADLAVLEALVLSVPPVSPRPEARRELLAKIAAEPRPETSPEGFFAVGPGVTGVRTSAAAWIASPMPAIEYKLISRTAESGMRTQLVRFAAGARYPRHRHAGTEEIFLIEGSVSVNGIVLHAGDYCRSDPGTEEIGTYSETGGLALIISSERDEVGAPAP